MIPIKIELQNFLSYGSQMQTVDFKEHPLVCLSGKNGHGKSALLDAITWSIWGQARKVSGSSKPDEGLLRLGQTYMMVSIEFIFNDDRYRIRREFTKAKSKNTQTLDFEVYDAAADRFIALTDKTIRATQAKINLLLRLDYTTFVNSAFIRQGQSNEFSQKNPKERKEILANILNLHQYDELKSKALEKARVCQETLHVSREISARAHKEIEQKELLLDQQSHEQKMLAESQAQVDTKLGELEQLEKKKASLIADKQTYTLLKERKESLDISCDKAIASFTNLSSVWREEHYALLALSKPDILEKKLAALRLQEEQMRAMQAQRLALEKKHIELQKSYQKAYEGKKNSVLDELKHAHVALEKSRLSSEDAQRVYAESLKKIASFSASQEKEKKLAMRCRTSIEQLQKQQKEYDALYAQYQKRKAYYSSLTQRGNWTQSEFLDLRRKQNALQDKNNPSCPLCDQMLSARRKQFLYHKFQGKDSFFARRVERIASILASLKKILIKQHALVQKEAAHLAQQEKKCAELRIEHGALRQALSECDERKKESLALKSKTETLLEKYRDIGKQVKDLESSQEKKIADDPELISLQKCMQDILTEIAKKGYDELAHTKILNQVASIQEQLSSVGDISALRVAQKNRLDQVHQAKKSVQHIRAEIATLQRKITKLEPALNDYDMCVKHEHAIKKELQRFQDDKQAHLTALSRLKTLLDRVEQLQKEQAQEVQKRDSLERELQDFQKLQTMFGKDGLQALLIEEAIPEIEAEANKILGRLTDNRAHIIIESLRDLKKGGVKETLNIQISDTSGIRPYEMFSGGEAFRIDFALRIAISKLLAHRSGTSLQTLIIDEGFGSQDDEGLSRLMDAIHTIQHDFSCIIIVSHLPIFKDNFPVHLMIEKGATGSVVSVLERG